ncbi:methyltransferase domain-containing protein [Shewanella sp. SG44-2]|uniref:methyltransferase domain-containing protein n=1 Tax=Shewanella sp. SG44-2 TaxID=2760962 RepID=UPI0016031AA5|nr:methyltransferase domain-containing protein [Shewanella sp. SG44-2]MBB1428159.1 methyltransferase domain-containing protein [Shewanella sp. SG44-2]
MQDKNFDKLSQKFAQNIYGTTKGEIRAAVLWRDLAPALASLGKPRLRILDAGGGFGYLSQKLAALGHDVVLCDISEQMLSLARQQIEASNTALSIQLIHSPIQALTVEDYGQFDVILCHAVAEWLIDARSTLQGLLSLLKPHGLFSLMFFNKEALRFHSLISGNFDYVNRDFKVKKKVGLTPTHPLYIEDVRSWFSQWQLSMVSQSGVRVINDYLKNNLPPNFDKHQLIEMELAYSQQEPYLSLGRYIHFVGRSIS